MISIKNIFVEISLSEGFVHKILKGGLAKRYVKVIYVVPFSGT